MTRSEERYTSSGSLCSPADTVRHCREVNESSLHSVPHWNFIRLYLPKSSGVFRSPSRGSLSRDCRQQKCLPLEGKVASETSRMRCSRSQPALSSPAGAADSSRQPRDTRRKRPRQRGKSLLFRSMSGVFFVMPASRFHVRSVGFRVGFREKLLTQKLPPQRLPHQSSCLRCCGTMPGEESKCSSLMAAISLLRSGG